MFLQGVLFLMCFSLAPTSPISSFTTSRNLFFDLPLFLFLGNSNSNVLLLTYSWPSSFEAHPLQVRHKQDWARGFILLLPQTAVLPGSDAGSDVIKPASSFVIQNRQTSCSMWCPMYRARC